MRLTGRKTLIKLLVLFLLYTGALKLLNRLVNRFQYKNNGDGKPVFPFVTRRRSRNVQILAYHRVNDENDPFFPATPTSQFAQQMKMLAERFTVCSLERALDGMRTGDIPENAVAITLDDGYRDNYVNAFPILKRYSIPATIFLATGAIGSASVLWHDKVFAAFRETRVPELPGFGPGNKSLSLSSIEKKLAAQKQVLEYLWSLDGEEREAAICRLQERLGVIEKTNTEGSRLMLSWEEVSEMHRQGIQFGAHTVTHPMLSKLRTESARQEIFKAKSTIEEVLNSAVTAFAYPVGRSGDFTATTKALVEEAGFRCGLTMIFGNNDVGTDLYEMRRIAPWDEDSKAFALRLSYYKLRS